MKASDLTSSSSEREEESRALLHTERTDAVNTGIVDSADRTSRTPARKVSKADRGDELTGHRPRKGGAGPDVDASVDDAASDGPSARSGNLKGKAAKGAKGLAAKGVHKALEDSELEGADTAYYGTRAVYRLAKRRLQRRNGRKAGKDVEANATEGKRKLSLRGRGSDGEVASTTDGTHGTQRGSDGGKAARSAKAERGQMERYYKEKVYTTAAAEEAPKKGLKSAAERLLSSKGKTSSAAKVAGGCGGGCALTLVVFILVFVLVASLIGILADESSSEADLSSLSPTEQIVAQFFLDKGLDELHTAAIMGNMKTESGMIPGNVQGWNRDCSSIFTIDTLRAFGSASNHGVGLCQWDSGRRVKLLDYAEETGEDWYDTSMQLDFFWEHDEWDSNWHGSNSHGYWSKAQFLATDDLEEAVKNFAWGWERCAADESGHINERIANAEYYYSALTGGYTGGEEYANAESWQKAIVQAAYNTPSTGSGYCAAWVSNVYRNAGFNYVGGNACCMYYNYCTSSDTDDLKVGMLVAFPRSETSYRNSCDNCGHLGYGHVGIYIGDGMVISNRGSIVVETLESFASTAYSGYVAKWGWPSGVPSS